MSVATAASRNPVSHRLPRRYHSTSICANRSLKPVALSDFPASRPHVWFMLHSMPLQRKSQFPDTSWWRIRAFASGEAADLSPRREVPGQLNLDEVLSAAEALCIALPVIFAVGSVVGLVLPGMPKALQANLGNAFFVWQFAFLVGAVIIGGVIRRRQWQRLCRGNGEGLNLIERIEKVEEDLRSSATIVRVLSKQLEKLGIRFRVTRKALKEPIAKMAALAQKNSEATRALAVQEDILEKELGEIQKVLLAMQEQQQKQLELIVAIGKARRLLESKRRDPESKKSSASETVTRASSSILENDSKTNRKIEIGETKSGQ